MAHQSEIEQAVLETVNGILKNRSRARVESLSPGDNLRNDVGLDSLDLAELTVKLEARFGIDIFADSLVTTVGEVCGKLK